MTWARQLSRREIGLAYEIDIQNSRLTPGDALVHLNGEGDGRPGVQRLPLVRDDDTENFSPDLEGGIGGRW